MKDTSNGCFLQLEDTAKAEVRESMVPLEQMKKVSESKPGRGRMLTMREEGPDLVDLRNPGSLYIICRERGSH